MNYLKRQSSISKWVFLISIMPFLSRAQTIHKKSEPKDTLIYHVINCKNNKVATPKFDKLLNIYGLYISDSLVKDFGWSNSSPFNQSLKRSEVYYYKPSRYKLHDLSKKIVFKKDTLLINALEKYTLLIAINEALLIGNKNTIQECFGNSDALLINHQHGFGSIEYPGEQIGPTVQLKAYAELDKETASWEYALYYNLLDNSWRTTIQNSDKSTKIVNIQPDSTSEPISDYNIEEIEALGLPFLVWYGYLDNDNFVDLILRYCKQNDDGYCEDDYQLILSTKLKQSYRKRFGRRANYPKR